MMHIIKERYQKGMINLYDPYRRYPPSNNPSQGSYRYVNNPSQGSYRYVNTTPQGNYGYSNDPSQGSNGYANTPPQGSYGYPNNNRMSMPRANRPMNNDAPLGMNLIDYGPGPFVMNIEDAAKLNSNFRTALWTGEHLQLTLMSINPGEDIGFEVHPHLDQFIRIEEGSGIFVMGDQKDNLDFQRNVSADDAFIIPAGKWHNLVNSGRRPLKLYSIYAPPQHPFGTVHATKEEAEAAEEHHGY